MIYPSLFPALESVGPSNSSVVITDLARPGVVGVLKQAHTHLPIQLLNQLLQARVLLSLIKVIANIAAPDSSVIITVLSYSGGLGCQCAVGGGILMMTYLSFC